MTLKFEGDLDYQNEVIDIGVKFEFANSFDTLQTKISS